MPDTHAKKTVNQTNLQALIAEIDSFLAAPALPEPEQQRQTLQQVKSYLVGLEGSNHVFLPDGIAQQISQSVITSINSNLTESFEKLQQELDGFYHHRNFLLQEIENLETKQQKIIADLASTLEQQINKIKNLGLTLQGNNQETATERINNLIELQNSVDKFIVNFDSTFRTVFDTLERDLQEYKKSISSGIEDLYNLGQQSYFNAKDNDDLGQNTNSSQLINKVSEVANIIDQEETQSSSPTEQVPKIQEDLTKPTILEEKKFYDLPSSKVTRKQIVNPDIETIKALTDIIDPEAHFKEETVKELWYLGIDFGTVGMAAVLFQARLQGHKCIPLQQCPIYWSYKCNDQYDSTFRLPTAVYSRHPNSPFILGILASETDKEKGFVLENFKPYLDLVPLADQKPFPWQNSLDENEEFPSLAWVQQAIEELLGTLTPIRAKDGAESELYDITIDAIGLSREILNDALNKLGGIVFSCPVDWSDTYRFNLRETLLKTGLVGDAGQIFFLEEPLANLLAHLPISAEYLNDSEENISTTLVINAGATKTELVLTELPENLQQLSYGDMRFSSWNYGEHFLTQDIICHLLYSQWMLQLYPSLSNVDLELPAVGETEIEKRQKLGLYLQSTTLGKSLVKAAEMVKTILQDREEFTSQVGIQNWTVKRQELEQKVTQIVLEKLFSHINQLLQLGQKSPEEITQIICSGGMSIGLGAILSDYLKTRFPNATLIQDGEEDNNLSIATGLSRLPLFPLILDRPRHQYGDYFLLLEMLETLPSKPFTLEEMLRLLQRRGVNIRVCGDRIFSILEGKLPLKTEFAPFTKGENNCYHTDAGHCEKLRQYFQHLLPQTQQKFTEPLVANLA